MDRQTSRALKINLGCGLDAPNGWVNIDNSPSARLAKRPALRYLLFKLGLLDKPLYEASWSRNIVTIDVCRGLPYQDGAAACVYCSMLISEMPHDVARALFQEVHRLLAPGGIFRLLTTDLRAFAREYIAAVDAVEGTEGDRAPATTFLRRLGLGRERGLTRLEGFVRGRADRRLRQWVYDEQSLRADLFEAGFRCESRPYRESAIDGIEAVERHVFSDVVCLECVKP